RKGKRDYLVGKVAGRGCRSRGPSITLFLASGPGSPATRGTARSAPATACPSFGSLKTEEKTERQCGQRWTDPRVVPDAVCQFQSPPVPTGGNQVRSGHSGRRAFPSESCPALKRTQPRLG